MKRYNPLEIEQKWQDTWERDGTYHVDLADTSRPKYYAFSMLPGITGAGIHIGHGRTFQFSDIKVRTKRQQGFNAYHPIGWDSFGLPVENYAIKVGKKPRDAHDDAKANFIRQLKRLGFSYDWSKEISTADPEYYKWTQWIFTQLLKHDLAYQKESAQWWCETDQTVLANEQVEGGRCWRCGNLVTKKNLKQWFFRITAYADEMLEATDDLNWTEMVKTMQKNWIGRSQGAEVEFVVADQESGGKSQEARDSLKFTPELTKMIVDGTKTSTIRFGSKNLEVGDVAEFMTRDGESVVSFGHAKITQIRTMKLGEIPLNLEGHEVLRDDAHKLEKYRGYYSDQIDLETEFTIYDFEFDHDSHLLTHDSTITVFTTRPDTLFGATFMVLAPEHELVSQLTTEHQKLVVAEYLAAAQAKSEIERMNTDREKTGVFTGSYAINPVNGERIPIWVADYVLAGYGTGAIMAVPAHDDRDGAFAEKFGIPVKQVVARDFGSKLEDAIDVTGAVVIVYDPKLNKFLGVKTGTNDGIWLNGGGTEHGESFEQTAIRELAEETGFTSYQRIEQLGDPVFSYYFNDVKQIAKRSFGQGYLFFVDSTQQGEAAREEHEKGFELDWFNYNELVAGIEKVGGGVEHWLAMLAHAKQIVDGMKPTNYYGGEGTLTNSGIFDGMSTSEAREEIVAWLEQQGVGRPKVQYKMRDWLISRQRYWGAPIPIIHCPEHGAVPVPDDQLPVILPDLDDFKPRDGQPSALASALDWVNTTCPICNGPATHETDTMDGYACSSWYFLRYIDPFNTEQAWSPEAANYWQPTDYYNGADHAVAHLLYSRFWMRFFYKQGWVPTPEPFKRMMYNAYIMAPDGQKMSKSKGNVIDPMEIMDSGYGADSLRVYEMFIAPYDQDAPWDTRGVPGTYRFLNRVWTLTQEYMAAPAQPAVVHDTEVLALAHGLTKKVTADIEDEKFNTAIAAMMETVNSYYKLKTDGLAQNDAWRYAIESLLQVLAPFAPHITEELWHELGHTDTIHRDHWPAWDDAYIVSDDMTIIVQVNGKLRAKLVLAKDTLEADVKAAALADETVARHLGNQKPTKVIYVPGRLVNVVLL